jgi:quinol monooxygenase YgiN
MIVVAGTYRVPVDKLDKLRPHAEAVIAATRAEKGCQVYSFAEDLLEPGLIRVFEIWESRAHLDAHLKAPHMDPWREAVAECRQYDRNIGIYTAESAGSV